MKRFLDLIGVRRLSLLYIGLVIVGIFALWVPETFLTHTTWTSILNNEAVSALIALSVMLALSAGAFDLSVGYMAGAAGMLITWLAVLHGVPVGLAIAITLLGAVIVGLLNGVLTVRFGINPLITTLGVGSCLLAFMNLVNDGQQITAPTGFFRTFANHQIGGVQLTFLYLVVVAAVLWFVLEHTATGRRLYATGANREAARLSGVRTNLMMSGAFVIAAVMAGFAGILLTSQVSVATPDAGPSYLLPAFAAAFLGSTQVRPGRFNVWGTLLAIYVLAIGVKGLQLAGAPFWLPDLFNGVALLIAVGLSSYQRQSITQRGSRFRRILGRDRGTAVGETPAVAE